MGIGAGDTRHHRGVNDPHSFDPSKPQLAIDYCIYIRAHAAGADRMKNGIGGLSDPGVDLLVRCHLWSRSDLVTATPIEGYLAENMSQ